MATILQLNCRGSWGVWADLAGEADWHSPSLQGRVAVGPEHVQPRVGLYFGSDAKACRMQVPSCDWCVFAAVTLGDLRLVVGSVYLAYSQGVSSKLEMLGMIVRQFRRDKLVLCVNANAKSPLWHSEAEDDRSRALEEFIVNPFSAMNPHMRSRTTIQFRL